MNERITTGKSARVLAAERLAEIDELSLSIRGSLREMIAELDNGRDSLPKTLLDKLNLLQAAHLKVLEAEDKFHDKIGTDPDVDATDYDAVRGQVGCLLNRLRESLLAEGLSCDAETRTACNAPLSVRLLGDAAPDTAGG